MLRARVWKELAICSCAALLLLSCGKGERAKNERRVAEGARVYARECAACHGLDGKAQTPEGRVLGAVDLTDEQWKNGPDREILIRVVTRGLYGTAMPPFEKKLTEDQIEDVVDYVRQLGQTK